MSDRMELPIGLASLGAWVALCALMLSGCVSREEIAKEYVTKAEVHADINRVLDRIDRLGEKMDRIMEMNNAK